MAGNNKSLPYAHMKRNLWPQVDLVPLGHTFKRALCDPELSPIPLKEWWAQVDSNHSAVRNSRLARFRLPYSFAHWFFASLFPPPAALGFKLSHLSGVRFVIQNFRPFH